MNHRRELLKAIALLPLAACTSELNRADGEHEYTTKVPAGWNPPGGELMLQKVKIKKVRAITTAPYGTGLVIVKVETDQPGLYGIGCATFTQRIKPVAPSADAAAKRKYVAQLTILHRILVHAMKAKQTTDLIHAEKLRSLLAEFEAAYFGPEGH